jgi:hypothetical protein
MRQFRIDDSERDRILNLHENATKRQYLKEDSGNYDLVSSDLEKIEGYNNERGKYKIITSPDRGFQLNHDSKYEVGNKVTLLPQTTISIPNLSGGLTFHKAPDYQFGFTVTVKDNQLKIGPTA